ncbi:unnamed protein product, partial [Iphiclides podalirius]
MGRLEVGSVALCRRREGSRVAPSRVRRRTATGRAPRAVGTYQAALPTAGVGCAVWARGRGARAGRHLATASRARLTCAPYAPAPAAALRPGPAAPPARPGAPPPPPPGRPLARRRPGPSQGAAHGPPPPPACPGPERRRAKAERRGGAARASLALPA